MHLPSPEPKALFFVYLDLCHLLPVFVDHLVDASAFSSFHLVTMAEEPAHSTTRKHSVDDVHDPSIVKKSRTSQHGSKNITSYDLKSWQPSPGRDTKKKLKPQKRREQARRKAQAEKETNPVREGGVEESMFATS